jgi:glycosyltransferase involved in cell wall biosynthesis
MGRTPTVGIVTVAVGEKYLSFLPEWLQAVRNLEKQPDQITIISDRIIQIDQYTSNVPLLLISSNTQWNHHPQVLINEAIESTHTDWICKMDADDLIYPHALNDWSPEADVIMFGITLNRDGQKQSLLPAPFTDKTILESEQNLIFSGSPFRKKLWENNKFHDMIFEDWAFWIGCAKQKARFIPTGRSDYYYNLGDHNISNGVDEHHWAEIVRSMK